MFIVYVLISFMYLRYHVAKNKWTNIAGVATIENMHDVRPRALARKPGRELAPQCCKPSAATLYADQAN